MATVKSKSRIRSPRNRARSTPLSAPADSNSHPPPVTAATLEDAIETERARLMTAEAVLHCVVIAMDETDGDDTQAPHYQSAVDLARGLVSQTINQLDSLRLGSVLGETGAYREYGVKEGAVEYVH